MSHAQLIVIGYAVELRQLHDADAVAGGDLVKRVTELHDVSNWHCCRKRRRRRLWRRSGLRQSLLACLTDRSAIRARNPQSLTNEDRAWIGNTVQLGDGGHRRIVVNSNLTQGVACLYHISDIGICCCNWNRLGRRHEGRGRRRWHRRRNHQDLANINLMRIGNTVLLCQ